MTDSSIINIDLIFNNTCRPHLKTYDNANLFNLCTSNIVALCGNICAYDTSCYNMCYSISDNNTNLTSERVNLELPRVISSNTDTTCDTLDGRACTAYRSCTNATEAVYLLILLTMCYEF